MRALPNLITLVRLALAPLVCYLILVRDYWLVLDVFAIAAVTDFLDGWMARRMGTESPVGALLDPVADKVLLSGVFVTLAITGAIPWWLAVLVLGRDVLILLAAGVLVLRGNRKRSLAPSILGKLSTVAQMLYVLGVVMSSAGVAIHGLVIPLAAVVTILTVASGVDYARR